MKTCPSCQIENPPDSRFCQNCGAAIFEISGIPDDPYLGRVFDGKFLIQKALGQGAMGKVYLAEQTNLGRQVCIKILHPHLAGDENLARRFSREARAAGRLNHPNSVQVTDSGRTGDGTLYLAMEYLAGDDLRRVIKRDVPFAPERIARILGQVLAALEEAHAEGIIHRDLKPENVMVINTRTEKDFVKVLDFGIAKIQDPGPDGGTLTVAGIVCGTPEYMAPEQARGDPLDNRVDIYAAGVILYQMLTGELPFKAESALATVTKHLTEEPIPPRQRRPDLPIPPRFEEICLKAMSKDRELRFRNALEMKEALDAAARDAVSGPVEVPAAAGAAAPPVLEGELGWSVGPVPGGTAEEPGPAETPLAFAVEDAPDQRRRSGGSLAAWIVAGAIVILGGTAVALWKLEIGPFAPPPAPVATARPEPAPAAPPVVPPPATKPTPSVEQPVAKPQVEAPPKGKLAPKSTAKKHHRSRKHKVAAKAKPAATPAQPAEDPEAALRKALSEAAATKRPPSRLAMATSTTPTPVTAEAQPPATGQPTTTPEPPKPKPKPASSGLPPPDPARARRAYEAGLRHLRHNRIAQAVRSLKEAVRYNPTNPEYHRDLGKAHFINGNRRHGKWHYRKYLQLYPGAPDAARIRMVLRSP